MKTIYTLCRNYMNNKQHQPVVSKVSRIFEELLEYIRSVSKKQSALYILHSVSQTRQFVKTAFTAIHTLANKIMYEDA